jgi:hypothetical protein
MGVIGGAGVSEISGNAVLVLGEVYEEVIEVGCVWVEVMSIAARLDGRG